MARARKKPAKAKPATRKPKAAKPKPKSRAAKPTAKPRAKRKSNHEAVPMAIGDQPSETSARRRSLTARERAIRSSPVVEILDDPHPIGALRRFLDSIKGDATEQQAQIALGSAQLILLPIAREHRGGAEVKELVDLVAQRWLDFGERRAGYHAQEFLRNAFAAVGIDRGRIAKLEALVPAGASAELLFALATAHAIARDKVAMLRAVEAALDTGASAAQFRRDPDFAPYAGDPDFGSLLARADLPAIPVDVQPYIPAVRRALDSLIATLRELGEHVDLRPPVRLDAILDAERVRKISLPNDYRALLTITNGMKAWGYEFFGAGDYREMSPLGARARSFLASRLGLEHCVPLASWGQPSDWLLYDPRGRVRGGAPGYVVVLAAEELPLDDLVAALGALEESSRDVLGTN